MTLPQMVTQLYQQGRADMALLVAGFIIVIPAVVLVLLLALSTACAPSAEDAPALCSSRSRMAMALLQRMPDGGFQRGPGHRTATDI